ncbi:tyrosine-type recombinase/integrase, partial [Mycobacterium avium]
MLGAQLGAQRADHPHRGGLLLRAVPARRRLPWRLFLRHCSILVSKVRSLQDFQGDSLPRTGVEALLETVAQDRDSNRQTDWAERDLAIILTALLAGLRAEELRQADVGDIRTTDDGAAVIHVKGKGGKERSVPTEAELLAVVETYLDSRAIRFPQAEKRRAAEGSGLARWSARSPLFVGRDGERITQGTLQSRIKRAFKRAGPDAQPVPGALIHGLRHTYATELAGSDVSVYTLMKLLGHESMTTSQRYVTAAGTETRSAAARN